MLLLCVSDTESGILKSLIKHEPHLIKGTVDLIVSCGDLRLEYIDTLACAFGCDYVYVNGNHDMKEKDRHADEHKPFPFGILKQVSSGRAKDSKDIDERCLQPGPDWLICGLEGSRWYNGRSGKQYREEEMLKKIKRLNKTIVDIRKKSSFRDVIVVSHAPVAGIHDQPDACHRGFEAFKHFIEGVNPRLWLHGHVHLHNVMDVQKTVTGQTTIVNCYEYKFIKLEPDGSISVTYIPSEVLKPLRRNESLNNAARPRE